MYHLAYLMIAARGPHYIIDGGRAEFVRRLERAGNWAIEEFRKWQDKGKADIEAKVGWFLEYFNEFVRYWPDLGVTPHALGDDEMEPTVTKELMREHYYRNKPPRE